MKSLIVATATLVSVSTFANDLQSVYKKDTVLPVRVQERVFEALKTQCPNLIMNWGLIEVITTLRVDKIDQGITDYYYTTSFSSRYYFDGMHPSYADITVESVNWDLQNGDDISIQKNLFTRWL